MSDTRDTTALAQIKRLTLFAVGMAPVVALVLIGLSRLQRDTPEWVYWQAELVFLIALKITYLATAILSVVGAIVFGFLLARRSRKGVRGLWLIRGFTLSMALLFSVALCEAACATWLNWSHRGTAVPVGGLAQAQLPQPPSLRFAAPFWQLDLRSNFPDPPDDGPIDVVVLGGSSAQGVPFDRWVSIGKIITWKLQEAIPGRPIRLNVIARAGDTLEIQHKLLCNLQHRPDLLVIYSGHNEFYSRLWWARNLDHYVSDQRPTRWRAFLDRLERLSPVCILIGESAEKCRIAIPPPPNTARDLVDVPNYTALEYSAILTDFRRRLEEMTAYAERVGALPVLILPPGNDAGFEPNRSFLPPTTPRDERTAFAREFLAAKNGEATDPAASTRAYRALIARQPCFAETHYRLGVLLEQAGSWDEAYREYVTARDLDGMPMRCPTPFQQVYRDVAARHRCILIDGQSYFHTIGRHGLLDDELFQDAMHPSFRGQIALAQAVLVALHARRAFGWPGDSAIPIINPAECAAHFGIDRAAWQRIALWWKGFHELISPLRYDTSLRMQKRQAGIDGAARIDAGTPPEAVGLPNVGVPAGVPLVKDSLDSAPLVPTPGVMPCLVD